jgi:hypothetical protein
VEYQPIASTLDVRTKPLSINDLFSMVANFDQRMEMFHGSGVDSFKSSALVASRGRHGGSKFSPRGQPKHYGGSGPRGGGGYGGGSSSGGGSGPHYNTGGHIGGGGSSHYQGSGGNNYSSSNQRPFYPNNRRRQGSNGGRFQGYAEYENKKKTNHIAKDCDWRYSENNSQRKKVGAAAETSYGVDTNWYANTGATDHITHELEKVTMHEKYRGHDQVHNANGEGIEISHVGHSIIKTPHQNIHLKNILHVPNTSKNLLSVHRIALDNKVFLEFHPYFFLIKDQVTKRILYRGRCVRGFYSLIP